MTFACEASRAKGDEIIKFTAKTISKNVHNGEYTNCFVGHIGGDDFVAIVDSDENYEEIKKNTAQSV